MNPSRARLLAPALCLASLLGVPAAATAQEPPGGMDDPLAQSIDAGQAVAAGPAELSAGHVDIGPRLDGDAWSLMVHDDGVIPSVWRSLDDAVIRVNDTTLLAVPDDPTYAFLGVAPGTEVHVVPQVQNPDAVWVGWNTQEPNVMAAIDRGVTLTLLGVQGPGALTVFLQAGNLTEPDVLWQSRDSQPQPLWVEVNTHTHANWVFDTPGEYLVQIEAAADLIDGRHVAHVATLRFAVGDAADADAARRAAFPQRATPTTVAAGPDQTGGPGVAADTDGDADGGAGGLVVGGIVVVLVLAAGAAAVVVRGGRAKRRAEAERAAAGGRR